ncbi:hypothetical protein [Beijerinckia sp. L45]|uniref:hypothetical protein n=1 Tax=Beijerinckia sp. L45 TaxID=1641855 RepID=UPI00131D58E0|nr:hypothetical protein [Beijerinckia sp. L45]
MDRRKTTTTVAAKEITILVGDVVNYPDTGPSLQDRHAHVIVGIVENRLVSVPICSWFDECDKTSVIEVGEVPWKIVKHRSYIEYASATSRQREEVYDLVRNDPKLKVKCPSLPFLKKVKDGLLTSPDLPKWACLIFRPAVMRRTGRILPVIPSKED